MGGNRAWPGDRRGWTPWSALVRGGAWTFVVASMVAIVALLLAWWLVERSWFDWVTPEAQHALRALRGALASLLIIWIALVVAQSRRRVAEEAEARLRAILDSAPDSIVILDRQGRIVLLNTQTERMFGHDRAALLGAPVEILVPAGLGALGEAAPGPGSGPAAPGAGVELIGRHRDGSEVLVEGRLAVVETVDRTVVACILRDIRGRKRADEALRKQTEVLQSILDSMGDAVIVADQHEHFLIFNPAAERMFGIGTTDTTSEEWSRQYGLYRTDQVTPYPADELPLRRSIQGAEVNDVEMFVRHPKAPEGLWTLINGRPLRDAEGGLRGGVIVCRDITEQHRFAENLRRSADELASSNAQLLQLTADLEDVALSRQKAYDQLERAYHDLKRAEAQLIQAEKLSALGQLIAGVAHEINNPLAFVANNVTVLRRDARALCQVVQIHRGGMDTLAVHQPALHAEIAVLCERIDLDYTIDGLERLLCQSGEGLQRIQQIVRDLRDFARLDEPEGQCVDLNEGIRSTVNIIAGHAKKHGVTLVLELGTLAPLRCFPGKINQVVMNLLANAIDASPQGPRGQVTLRTCESARMDVESNGGGGGGGGADGGVEIHVMDNGQGIDPAIRDRIFDAFFTTKPQGQGTGLGLSISLGIIRAHHGRIEVDSTPGQGTHFTVFVPRIRAREAAPPETTPPLPCATAEPLAGDA